jgi:hypothetical protein
MTKDLALLVHGSSKYVMLLSFTATLSYHVHLFSASYYALSFESQGHKRRLPEH